mmetsp:Transcript_40343/g.63006  ORF Transcript_40343/g.63006 Transcript_40343/m.63006 type:complete len:304 (-) Transcript_40343:4-915(-)
MARDEYVPALCRPGWEASSPKLLSEEKLRLPRSDLQKTWADKKKTSSCPSTTVKSWIAAARGNSGHGPKDITEEFVLTNMMLQGVYNRQLQESESVAVLDQCPELFWLVECHVQNPLPPGWRRSKVAAGDAPMYFCEATGDVIEEPPTMCYYVRFAQIAAHMCYGSMMASQATASLTDIANDATLAARELQLKWTGPHTHPETGDTFYHCPSTGVSSYDDPAGWAIFVRNVATTLSQHLGQTPPHESRASAQTKEKRQAHRQKSKDTIVISPRPKVEDSQQKCGFSMADRIRNSDADSPKRDP